MNAKLFLAALLLVVVMVGSENSAKKLNSIKFSKKSAFEKRGGGSNRDRRDLTDFQTQLNATTFLDIKDPTNCTPFPCVSSVNESTCPAFCDPDEVKYGQIVDDLIKCYAAEICNRDFTTMKLPNPVNLSIATGNYNGQCYIYGPQITVTLKNQSNSVEPEYFARMYSIKEKVYYDFTGLSLYCRPNLPCSTNDNSGGGQTGSGGGGWSCCGDDLITKVLCLVQLITDSLGLRLTLLPCDCSCGKREVGLRAPTDSAPFQIPLTVTQQENFDIVIIFGSEYTYNSNYESESQATSVTFASPLPTPYANDITSGIQAVFETYEIVYALQHNFYYIISKMLIKFYENCPYCPDS